MSGAFIGLGVGVFFTLAFLILFRHESLRGARYGEHYRARADLVVLKLEYGMHQTARYIVRDLLKQIGHYSFHTLLRGILICITRAEKGLRNVMRVNKTLAKSAERESTIRTKLEELRLHKAENALTEEEKKSHKDRALNGF